MRKKPVSAPGPHPSPPWRGGEAGGPITADLDRFKLRNVYASPLIPRVLGNGSEFK